MRRIDIEIKQHLYCDIRESRVHFECEWLPQPCKLARQTHFADRRRNFKSLRLSDSLTCIIYCLTNSLLSLVYSVTRFRNWRLAHVASCQPDIGAWHRLYTSALLWSQDSWSSFLIGTSYKDHQVKRRCVREKFTEWSLEVWMFKFYITKCYIRRTRYSESKRNLQNSYL